MPDICPKCGSEDVDGPLPSQRPHPRHPEKFQPEMLFYCRGCQHGCRFDVHGSTEEVRLREANARWRETRPARMAPMTPPTAARETRA